MVTVRIKDSRDKEWDCELVIDGTVAVIEPKGYSKLWPFNLAKDKTFINNTKEEFKKLGMTKNVRVYNSSADTTIGFIGDGVKEMAHVFKKKTKPAFRDVFKY